MPWIVIGPREEYETYVDDCDVHLLEEKSWYFSDGYVRHKLAAGKHLHLHREILKPLSHEHTDHIDGNGLNNSRSNLRICTHAQNMQNVMGKGAYQRKSGRWQALIRHESKQMHIGYFDTYEEAHAAYLAKSKELRGEFAREELSSTLGGGEDNS